VLWRLDTPGETLVYGLKYDGREDIARSVARVLQQQNLPYFDLITFVPDTAARQRERGFVPAQLIARELSRVSGKPYIELLDRIEHTPQVGAGRTQRWQQVRGNFRAKHTELAYDKRVLLIDDVVTTGATITECAKTLKSAGTGPIYVAALAKQ
jgi:ComF family protein